MDTLDKFVDYLKTNDLIIAPRDLVENYLEVRTAKDLIKLKKGSRDVCKLRTKAIQPLQNLRL